MVNDIDYNVDNIDNNNIVDTTLNNTMVSDSIDILKNEIELLKVFEILMK